MFVDASALVAILTREPDAADLALRLSLNPSRYTSPVALYEAALGVARLRRIPAATAQTVVTQFLTETDTQIVPITAEIGTAAIEAFDRFGRGNHPARLNMGDCFAYACARSLGVALLCKGEDFRRTDIALA